MVRYKLLFNGTYPTSFRSLFLDNCVASDQGYTYTSGEDAVSKSIARFHNEEREFRSKEVLELVEITIEKLFPRVGTYNFVPAEEAWKKLDLRTSAGLTHPGKTKGEALGLSEGRSTEEVERAGNIAYSMYKGFKHAGKHRNEKYPCKVALKPKVYKYGDEKEHQVGFDVMDEMIEQDINETKVRVIWVAPIEAAIFEQCFYQSFYEYNKKNVRSPMLMGKDAKKRVLDMSVNPSDWTTVSLDWSGFDQSVPSWIIYAVIKGLVHRLSLPEYCLKNDDGTSFKEEALEILASNFIHTCLMLPNGKLFTKHRGIPSGSGGTQLIGTIVNMVVIQYLLELNQVKYSNLCCLGDDSRFETELDVDQMKQVLETMRFQAADMFGMELHPEKCEVNPAHGRNAFLGFASVDGKEVVNEEKFLFKLDFASYTMKSFEEELLRFVALYISGGYALEDYQEIVEKLKDSGYRNPITGEMAHFDSDFVVDKEMKQKFRYVYGVELGALIPKIPDILETPIRALREGKLSMSKIYARYTVPNWLSNKE